MNLTTASLKIEEIAEQIITLRIFKKLEEEKVQEKDTKCLMINAAHPQFTQKSNEILGIISN